MINGREDIQELLRLSMARGLAVGRDVLLVGLSSLEGAD